jgi:hypothetical protein
MTGWSERQGIAGQGKHTAGVVHPLLGLPFAAKTEVKNCRGDCNLLSHESFN